MHNTIQIIGNLGRDPEQREARANGAPFTVLSVATRRAWKNAEGAWESRTDWHRVVCFQRIGESALELHKGDQVFVAGSLVSSKYDRQVGSGKKAGQRCRGEGQGQQFKVAHNRRFSRGRTKGKGRDDFRRGARRVSPVRERALWVLNATHFLGGGGDGNGRRNG